MAAVAVAGVASAQVTITGSLGFGMSDDSGSARSIGWTDGKVTFAASEDLGGGMSISASNTLESKGDAAASTGVNSGGSSIALTTATMGKITFGSAGASSADLAVGSLPYDTNTLLGGTTDDYTYFQYDLPTLVDGLSIGVRLAGVDTAATNVDKQLRFAYTMGDATVNFNTKSTSTGTASAATLTYAVAGMTLKAYADTSIQTTATDKRYEYSISAPVGALTVSASNMTKGSLKANEVNASYALSKRTTAQVSFGSYTGGTKTSANRVKLVHTF